MIKRIVDAHNDEEVKEAYNVAFRGAMVGAAKWGLVSGLFFASAYFWSPIYRGLTPQFKIFLQMSSMTFGGMIEGDRRMLAHELKVRERKRAEQKADFWRRVEEEYGSGWGDGK